MESSTTGTSGLAEGVELEGSSVEVFSACVGGVGGAYEGDGGGVGGACAGGGIGGEMEIGGRHIKDVDSVGEDEDCIEGL